MLTDKSMAIPYHSYTILGHRKDIKIEDARGAYHVQNVENERIAEAKHKLDQVKCKKE